MSDWEYALNTFRLPDTKEQLGILQTCIHPAHPPLRLQGEFPWKAVIYERGPEDIEAGIVWMEQPSNPNYDIGLLPADSCMCWKVRARVISNEPYCAVSINNVLEPLGLWIPSTAEVIANAGVFFYGERNTIQIIEKENAMQERRNVCAMAVHN